MIDRFIEFSIHRRWAVILLAALVALGGVRAVFRTPIDAIPDLSENQVIVFAEWPGHGPREIEDQITYPLALELKGLAGVRVVRSSSDVGFAMINVIFEDGVGWDDARARTGEALARPLARLPDGVTPRLAPDAAATGQIYWYALEGGSLDPGRLRAVQDWFVRPQLAAVPGVAEVASVGGFPPEYQVELDPHRLRARGITPEQVADAVRRANGAIGGDVAHKGNAEFVVRGVGWLGARPGVPDSGFEPQRVVRDLENVTITAADGSTVALSEIARVALGSGPRRGILEKDGTELAGGVVLMRHGENPLEVTRRLRAKIAELQPGLPHGVHVVPFYDRTPLIRSAVGTVTSTLVEAILTATVCIVLVLRHVRTAFVVALTLPLAVLISFGLMDLLRRSGLADIQTNLMSVTGLAISIGVLVDSAIVMAENAMHHLRRHFGDAPVRGDTREIVLTACREVGRPIFFSVVIMLLSFLPVFALGGLEGKMFRPLAFTKSFAMLAVGLLAITLVPALCTVLVRGRLRGEEQVKLVRGLMQVYRPLLSFFMDRPAGIVWFVGLTFVLGAAPLGHAWLFRGVIGLAVLMTLLAAHSRTGRFIGAVTLILAGLIAQQAMTPLQREFLTPLDEGMVMDMPITVPRMSATQAADDLKARDMVFCRFPEVDMVVGKAGRAETATDPAPLDMIETMINFRPREFWPRRCLRAADAERQALAVLDDMARRELIEPIGEADARRNLANEAAMEATALFDAQMREAAYQRNKEFERDLGPRLTRFAVQRLVEMLIESGSMSRPAAERGLASLVDAVTGGHAAHLAMGPTPEALAGLVREATRHLGDGGFITPGTDSLRRDPGPLRAGWDAVRALLGAEPPNFLDELHDAVRAKHREEWTRYAARLNVDLRQRGPGLYTRLVLEALLQRTEPTDERIRTIQRDWHHARYAEPANPPKQKAGEHHHGGRPLPDIDPVPQLSAVQSTLTERFAAEVDLIARDRIELAGFGGELDRAMQMPGWTNVWTMPIQNRVDMLATGVNTTVGVRVLGRRIEDVVGASEEIAAVLKTLPGAADVIADPVRGKGYLEVHPDRSRCLRLGVDVAEVISLVEIALGGRVVTTTVEGRERHPVRVRFARAQREDEESLRRLPIRARTVNGFTYVPLAEVADIRVAEGPAAIKGENGLLRNYVRLNVRGRDSSDFVEAARQAVASRVRLPDGVFVEWTGQFEHEARAGRTLRVAGVAVVLLIFLVLWWTYRDLADAVLMLLTVPGALAGGVLLQWMFGYPLSVTSWVGYIACFGMATSTGIVMLVYLRQAVAAAGPWETMTAERLRTAVLDGAVHRLRPKLLTEATTLIGLAPLLLSSGTGSEILRPMVVPVVGGLLIADEVIDLFLPVLFYRVRLRRLSRGARGREGAFHF